MEDYSKGDHTLVIEIGAHRIKLGYADTLTGPLHQVTIKDIQKMIETSAAGIFQTLKKEKNWLSLRPEKIAQILLEICNLPHKYNNLRTKKGELIEPEIKSETNSDIHPESQLESHTEVNFVQGNECQQNITSTSKNSVFKLRDPWVLSAVVLCLPISIFQSRQELEHWCRAFMEVLEVAAIAFVPQPLMACYGCGVVNGLVLDIGYETLQITPVIDSNVIFSGHAAIPFAGRDLENLKDLKSVDSNTVESLVMLNVLLEGEADSVAPSEREAIQIIHVLYSILRHFEFDKQNTLLNHVILTGGTLCKLLSSSKCDASGENVSDQEFNLVKMLERVKLAMERITGISEFASDLQPRLSAIQFRKIPDYFKSSISTRTPSLEESPLISDSALMSTENASFLDTVFFGACLAARLVYADNRYFISRAEYNSFGPKISWAKLLMN